MFNTYIFDLKNFRRTRWNAAIRLALKTQEQPQCKLPPETQRWAQVNEDACDTMHVMCLHFLIVQIWALSLSEFFRAE